MCGAKSCARKDSADVTKQIRGQSCLKTIKQPPGAGVTPAGSFICNQLQGSTAVRRPVESSFI